jgi:hypothetical protein
MANDAVSRSPFRGMAAAANASGELELMIETADTLGGCPECGAVARAKDRRPTWVADLPSHQPAGGAVLEKDDM